MQIADVDGRTSCYQLTAGVAGGQTGAAWTFNQVDISDGFTITTDFIIDQTGGSAGASGEAGADGMALVLHQGGPTTLGGSGNGIGYGGLNPSLARTRHVQQW